MKSYIIPAAFILIAILSVTTTGCLKDKAFDDGSIQSVHTNGSVPQIIELKLTASSASNFLVLALDNSNNDTVLNLVPVNLATADPAPQDIHVTVALDSSIVTDYNNANGTSYSIPSSSIYSIVNPEVVIPKGSHTGYLQVKIKPSDFLGLSVALGFRITNIQEPGYTISGNLSTGIATIVVKNEWDGNYDIHVEISGVNAYTGTVFGDTKYLLSTVNATTVHGPGAIGDWFGGYEQYTFNADGTVTVLVGGDASNPNGYGAVVNSSSYDKATHSFHVNYSFLGGKYIFDETYVKE